MVSNCRKHLLINNIVVFLGKQGKNASKQCAGDVLK
jgi:hypothetical protein